MSEELKDLKKRFISIIQTQVNGDLSCVDAKELGEVVDMLKDITEAEYYCDITKAMSESSPEEKEHYMSKYAPETSRYYTRPMMDDWRPDIDRDKDIRKRMYFTEPTMNRTNNGDGHDARDGRSYMSRRTYMDMKDKGRDTTSEMEQYISDLSSDLTEMIEKMTAAEKAVLKQKISVLASKIN